MINFGEWLVEYSFEMLETDEEVKVYYSSMYDRDNTYTMYELMVEHTKQNKDE